MLSHPLSHFKQQPCELKLMLYSLELRAVSGVAYSAGKGQCELKALSLLVSKAWASEGANTLVEATEQGPPWGHCNHCYRLGTHWKMSGGLTTLFQVIRIPHIHSISLILKNSSRFICITQILIERNKWVFTLKVFVHLLLGKVEKLSFLPIPPAAMGFL